MRLASTTITQLELIELKKKCSFVKSNILSPGDPPTSFTLPLQLLPSYSLFYLCPTKDSGQTRAHTPITWKKVTMRPRLTRCRWCVEGDLRAVGTEHGVPAASDPEGVQAVRVQVTHHSAGPVNPVCSPPDPTVLTILLGRRLARTSKSGKKKIIVK